MGLSEFIRVSEVNRAPLISSSLHLIFAYFFWEKREKNIIIKMEAINGRIIKEDTGRVKERDSWAYRVPVLAGRCLRKKDVIKAGILWATREISHLPSFALNRLKKEIPYRCPLSNGALSSSILR